MIKVTKKSKKSGLHVEAYASGRPKPAPVRLAAPTVAQPASAKSELPKPAGVALELVAPAARQVFVAGSFNGWKPETTPLVPLGNGRWKGDLTLGPGRHEYLFVVDGQWRADPNARESVANPFGGRNSVIIVSE
jgi:1,4-alpha-glucan branching enzyme